ncbi:arabinose transporter [Mesorhizobium sp. NPDC059054]|uniref:arabinose transporter n=1 Tax=Mesorhizobium sp. NPDC059054 TaxID=3346711 RepID=UPI00368806E5
MTDMGVSAPPHRKTQSVVLALLPIIAAVLAGFLVIGAALPVLPLHVSGDLGFGTLMVGLVAGAQFAASLISRVWSGSYSDAKGGKRAVVVGLITAAIAGLLYLVSLAFELSPVVAVTILLLGRAVLGGAESFIITGGVSWGLALVDPEHAGKVIAWVGTAMFASLALGGPLGSMLFASFGFAAIGLVTAVLPLMVLMLFPRARGPVPQPPMRRSNTASVIRSVWLPGLGAAFASVGYCAILAFSSLLYADRNWQPIWLAFTAFGAALIVARIFVGHLPDRHGGAKVALLFVLMQSAGLAFMGLAKDVTTASAGAAFAGLGYSLVYPGLGVEAVRGASPENRGLAMGIFTAFLDVAMAAGSPALGWIASRTNLSTVFVVSAVITFFAAAVSFRLILVGRSR